MTLPSSNSNAAATSSTSGSSAAEELTTLVAKYNRQNPEHQIDPTLNELIYIVVRLADSIQKDPRHTGGWSKLVVEVKRRLYSHLGSGKHVTEEF